MTLTLVLTFTVIAMFVFAQAAPATRPRISLTRVERAVLLCETRMNWRHHSVGRSEYEGAPGFLHSSWVAFRPKGAPLHAYNATPRQQILAMRAIRARYGWSGWGCYVHGGYRSHL